MIKLLFKLTILFLSVLAHNGEYHGYGINGTTTTMGGAASTLSCDVFLTLIILLIYFFK
jgi:hypothetical protein